MIIKNIYTIIMMKSVRLTFKIHYLKRLGSSWIYWLGIIDHLKNLRGLRHILVILDLKKYVLTKANLSKIIP